MNKNFRTYQLAVQLYKQSSQVHLPSHLKDQLLRAASSIVLNLAEGSARRTSKDRARFFNIALASTREVQAIMDLEERLKNCEPMADQIGAMIYNLIQSQK